MIKELMRRRELNINRERVREYPVGLLRARSKRYLYVWTKTILSDSKALQ